MLLPINSLTQSLTSINHIKNSRTYKQNDTKCALKTSFDYKSIYDKKIDTTNCQNQAPYGYKSLYDKNNINFTHYISSLPDTKLDNEEVYNPFNYKLGRKALSDGSIIEFQPDKTQVDVAKCLLNGDSVLYCAPTGTGKTAVAHFAIAKNNAQNKKTIITVPQIALANDKYNEFKEIYGEDSVGILTGERKVNPRAPITIMTAEILYNQSNELENRAKSLGTIILDEAHYINDEDRGNVWENTIMEAAKSDIQLLLLSATIGNDDKFVDWVQSINKNRYMTEVKLSPKERYVPLVWKIYNTQDDKKQGEFIRTMDTKIDINGLRDPWLEDKKELSDKQKRALKAIAGKNEYEDLSYEQYQKILNDFYYDNTVGEFRSVDEFKSALHSKYPNLNDIECEQIAWNLANPDDKYLKQVHMPHIQDNFPELVEDLKENDMLPAIIFKLTIGGCDNIARELRDNGEDLTTDDEKEEIKKIIEKYRQDGAYLGSDLDTEMLLKGYAVHTSAKLPQERKLVEELFAKKLVKVVSATSTLSLGINMPARTVVMTDTQYRKYNPETKELEDIQLTANEFHQMAGRAGRRGIDEVGNVVFYNLGTPSWGFRDPKKDDTGRIDNLLVAYNLLMSKPDNLRSRFKPDSAMLAQYYEENNDNFHLNNKINNAFKVFLAPDKDKAAMQLQKRFENYSSILLKQGCLIKNYKKQLELTPKGKILSVSQGANPLMLASMIYDKKLKDLSLEQLCQFAGLISGSDAISEEDKLISPTNQRIKSITQNEVDLEKYIKTNETYKQKQSAILKSVKEAKVPPSDIMVSNSFSGFIAYLFAYLNKKDDDSISNFEKIVNQPTLPLGNDKAQNEVAREFNRRLNEGHIYKSLAQSVSVLKQIDRICTFALNNPDDFYNVDYYKNLQDKTQQALYLMKMPPINEVEA